MRIINGILHTMAGVVYENGYVDVINGKIADLGAMAVLPEPVAGEEVLDVQGAFVMPGIIEAHCHVGMIEEKRGQAGDDCNDATSPLTPGLRAVDASIHDRHFTNAWQQGLRQLDWS
jgi:imidazolonepropionase-like amidohydrolase